MNRLIIIFIFFSNLSYAQTILEFKDFYSNLSLESENLFFNGTQEKLDSLGRISINDTDSLNIHFADSYAHKIIITSVPKNLDTLHIYKFGKYSAIESSIYVEKKSWFGLVKKYSSEPGPMEEQNKHDIFLNRDSIKIKLNHQLYTYYINDKYREVVKLKIKDF